MSEPTSPQNATTGAALPGVGSGVPVLPPLDSSLYRLDEEEVAFFKQKTGINSSEDLKQHILKVQAEAYEVHPYPCIRLFGFAQLKISRLPVYNDLLILGKERRDAILLDIGCCFGNDVRKAVTDGYPLENVIASDIEPAFWQLGHRLFKSSTDSFPVPFIGGDAFDPAFLQTAPPVYAAQSTPAPTLSKVTTLTMLQGHVSAIHASSLFHLFDEEKQLVLARAFASLLSPIRVSTFCHSPESWKEMWESVFGPDQVKVETELQEVDSEANIAPAATNRRYHMLVWSVKRL
ncbi:uncharacterized protein B0H18DRAFT_1101993 [Fomitopsis serialis]|uniref:uncharacterized protein n=1 Tax=Fomitopsis serialis TaxID=139415 RepID=UPI002007B5D5|nr:uncharacterized protein B0H18DRAFT_1101993 [Neoantrodia serialis]KAH9933312.1 hypothetical protein B0H18DRAFT_1101993 [Neoantrodia serialis]